MATKPKTKPKKKKKLARTAIYTLDPQFQFWVDTLLILVFQCTCLSFISFHFFPIVSSYFDFFSPQGEER
jgi:hypothetical protein